MNGSSTDGPCFGCCLIRACLYFHVSSEGICVCLREAGRTEELSLHLPGDTDLVHLLGGLICLFIGDGERERRGGNCWRTAEYLG